MKKYIITLSILLLSGCSEYMYDYALHGNEFEVRRVINENNVCTIYLRTRNGGGVTTDIRMSSITCGEFAPGDKLKLRK